ncbi:MAG TPA: FtsQ-type POTRA domain-containing protein [Gaiellaceae bacterium]|nr:FtsQ-type POTRA domain-containing protein [Gaiellaceae bacterium]
MPQQPPPRARTRAAVVHLPALERAPIARLLPSGRSLLVGFAIVAGAAGVYLLARSTPMFSLSRIEILGAPPSVTTHVGKALEPLEGRSLLRLDSADVARRLAALPDVAAATYDRDFPHTLRVVVQPEHPVAVARRGAEAWLVAASTRAIAAVPLHTQTGLPRIWLAHSNEPELGAAIEDRMALRAVRALAVARRTHFPGRIRMVRVRERDLTFLLGSGIELRLGDLRAVPLKLAIAGSVLPRLAARGGYLYLDVSAPERPVAGERLDSKPEP